MGTVLQSVEDRMGLERGREAQHGAASINIHTIESRTIISHTAFISKSIKNFWRLSVTVELVSLSYIWRKIEIIMRKRQ